VAQYAKTIPTERLENLVEATTAFVVKAAASAWPKDKVCSSCFRLLIVVCVFARLRTSLKSSHSSPSRWPRPLPRPSLHDKGTCVQLHCEGSRRSMERPWQTLTGRSLYVVVVLCLLAVCSLHLSVLGCLVQQQHCNPQNTHATARSHPRQLAWQARERPRRVHPARTQALHRHTRKHQQGNTRKQARKNGSLTLSFLPLDTVGDQGLTTDYF